MSDTVEEKPTSCEELSPSNCQVCGEALSKKPVVICHKCKTAHHTECWRYNRGCSVYGCGCRTSELPAPQSLGSDEPFSFSVLPPVWICLALIFSSFLSLGLGGIFDVQSDIAVVMLILWFFVGLFASVGYIANARTLLTFNPTGQISRRLVLLGRTLGMDDRDWLRGRRVVEVHLHRYEEPQTLLCQDLFLALDDGRRVFLAGAKVASGSALDSKMEDQAEQVAAWADTTVRFLTTKEAPSRSEIQEAAIQTDLGLTPRIAVLEEEEDQH